MGDLVAIGHCVEVTVQPDLPQDDGGVPAGGTNGDLHAALFEHLQRGHGSGQHGVRRQLLDQLHIVAVFAGGHFHLLLLGVGLRRLFQNDLQTGHTAHAPQTLVHLAVKGNAFFVGHALPSQIVTIIGGDDHAVQIENNAQNRFVHLRKPPW